MKTAIVTGVTGNLGRAVVHQLLKNGWQVAGSYNLHSDRPVPHFPGAFSAHAVDLGVETSAAEWVGSVISVYDTVTVGVLTVGGFAMGSIDETDGEDLYQQYRLNFETAYHVARPLLAHMLDKGHGRIILIGSLAGMDMQNSKGMVAYGLAKSLVFRLAELINDEAGEADVRAVVVVPNIIDTQTNRLAMPEADFSKWQTPDVIAEKIVSLCGAGAEFREVITF